MTDTLTHDLLGGHLANDTHCTLAAEHLLDPDQDRLDIHVRHVGVEPSTHLLGGHRQADTQEASAAEHLLPAGHSCNAIHGPTACGDTSHPTPTKRASLPTSQPSGWDELRLCADLFHRAQEERKACANMLRHHDAAYFAEHFARMEATEHAAKLMLRRCYRRVVPAELRAWQQANLGIGEDSIARVLGHLGDPYYATPHWWEGTGSNRTLMVGEPYARTVSQLWQYAGHGDASRRKTKGMTADEAFALGNPMVKMLVHLQAEWCMKSKGQYRKVYETAREAALDKVHGTDCVRCGPSGRPALAGTPWSAAHQHAHALRIVGKEILRDMWTVRRDAEAAR